jgi:hypothetical protein
VASKSCLPPPHNDKSRVTKDPALFRNQPHSNRSKNPHRSVTLALSPKGRTGRVEDSYPPVAVCASGFAELPVARPAGPPPHPLGAAVAGDPARTRLAHSPKRSAPHQLYFSPRYAILIVAEGRKYQGAPQEASATRRTPRGTLSAFDCQVLRNLVGKCKTRSC